MRKLDTVTDTPIFFFEKTRQWTNVHLRIRERVKGQKVRTTSDDVGGKSVSEKSKSTVEIL